MKLGDIRDDYYTYSGKLSDISRNMCFAGIAVIWALRLGEAGSSGIPYSDKLLTPLVYFALSLAMDFIQYAWSTAATGIVNSVYWKKHKDNDVEVEFPSWLNHISILLFFIKLLFSFIGIAALILYLWKLL